MSEGLRWSDKNWRCEGCNVPAPLTAYGKVRGVRSLRSIGWSTRDQDRRSWCAGCEPPPIKHMPRNRRPGEPPEPIEGMPDYLGVTCSRCGRKEPQLRSSQAKALGWGSVFNLRVCPKCLPSAQREVA